MLWKDVLRVGTVEGFAAFDPDEKDHTLGPAVCEVVMKDGEGHVVAKVCPPSFRAFSDAIALAIVGIRVNW